VVRAWQDNVGAVYQAMNLKAANCPWLIKSSVI
jgi:hypothetical protein